jgi:hypothetical protein
MKKSEGGDNDDPPSEIPGDEINEDLRPGPNTPVIKKESLEEKDRSWLMRVYLGLLAFTLVGDLVGGAWLSAQAWAQVKPEIASIRSWLFQVGGVIIGFYYGSAVRNHRN